MIWNYSRTEVTGRLRELRWFPCLVPILLKIVVAMRLGESVSQWVLALAPGTPGFSIDAKWNAVTLRTPELAVAPKAAYWRMLTFHLLLPSDPNHGRYLRSDITLVHKVPPLDDVRPTMSTILRDECDTEIQTTSATSKPGPPEELASGTWTRTCPRCNTLLAKIYPWMSIVCQCGWHWES